jgi:nicotinamide phosphoribosyltransferase
MMTVENTDPECFALTNHLETMLTRVWSPCTTATLSFEIMKLLEHYAEETSVDDSLIKFRTHDFGARGVSSRESAAIQGAGHLLNFMGTDTIAAMELAHNYYDASYDGLAYSVPATEHSVMTSLGPDGESELLLNLINKYPTGILSLVIDSYNYNDFILKHAAEHKDAIEDRDGVTVFRPDSGDPESVTLDVLNALEYVFGSTLNSKGYKVLNPKIGVFWGDGIDYYGIRGILHTMKSQGWAASNIVFGCGGGLLQKMNRDTQRFAFKCSAQKRHGTWIDISKNPLDSSKASKKGRLKLIRDGENEDGKFITIAHDEPGEDHLGVVFENGNLIRDISFDECRKNTGLW